MSILLVDIDLLNFWANLRVDKRFVVLDPGLDMRLAVLDPSPLLSFVRCIAYITLRINPLRYPTDILYFYAYFRLCRWFRFAQLAKGKKFRP